MRHKKARLQLNRFTSWRKATLVSLARSILLHQSIRTTVSRAKAVSPLVEKLISLAKSNTLAAKRRAYEILSDHALVSMLFNEIGPRFKNRNSGFTRIIHLGKRRGDDADIVVFELTEIKKKEVKKVAKKSAKAKAGHSDAIDVEAGEAEGEKVEQTPAQDHGHAKHETDAHIHEHPEHDKKPSKKFLGNLRGIFKKERDSL